MTARIGVTNIERPLVGIDGSAIPTRLLAPNYLYGTLMDSAAARLIEPLFPRPQDFEIAVVWVDAPRSPIPPAGTLTPAIVASGATFTVPQFQFPDYPGTESAAWLYFGVPTFAPPLDRIEVVGQSGTQIFRDSDEVTRLEGLYSGGIVRLVGALRLCLPGSTDSCSGRTYEELMPPYTDAAAMPATG